jgi:UDP-N-acetylmuramoyl-L-alanyl-D-glutamate--2,6-diaminopimelate ligase
LIQYASPTPDLDARAHAVTSWLLARVQRTASLTLDSRAVRAGDVFFAVPGTSSDGRQFVGNALQAGAAAVLAQSETQNEMLAQDKVLHVPDLISIVGRISSKFYGEPSKQLAMIAITGTNGKTSVSQWTAQALTRVSKPAGVIGTLGAGPVDQLEDFGMTTPDSPKLHGLLAGFVAQGLRYAVFEASSIGIQERRLDAVAVQTAVFTNLSQDHLDYHGTMQAYGEAKLRLFGWQGLQHAVVNLDDDWSARVVAACAAQVKLIAYSLDATSAKAFAGTVLLAQAIGSANDHQKIDVSLWHAGQCRERQTLELQLVGQFNISNALAVAGVLLCHGLDFAQATSLLASLRPVPGRMQAVPLSGAAPLVVVDYAHTPDALEKTLLALRPTCSARAGRLIAVFGAGGDRDRSKRPLMGQVAGNLADLVIVTSDNPRSEDANSIAQEIVAGMRTANAEHVLILDRAKALAHALASATAKDVILVAGKGHEAYQEIAGVRYPFDDAQVLKTCWSIHV